MRNKISTNTNVLAFVALSILKEKQSILEVASSLNISQSTVSKLLAELKVEFNDPLYAKANNSFTFSKIGNSVCSVSKCFFEPGIELIDRIKQSKEKQFSILMPKWIDVYQIRRKLLAKFPDIDCRFSFRLVDNFDLNFICESLMNGFADVCICHFPYQKAGIQIKEICSAEIVFISKNGLHAEIQDLNSNSFIKYNISDNLFNSFLYSNNIESLNVSDDFYGVEQWLGFIDSNKIIMTTARSYQELHLEGYTKIATRVDIITKYPIHLIWNAKHKYDLYLSGLRKIILEIVH